MKVQKVQTHFLKFLLLFTYLNSLILTSSKYELRSPQELFKQVDKSLKRHKRQYKYHRSLNDQAKKTEIPPPADDQVKNKTLDGPSNLPPGDPNQNLPPGKQTMDQTTTLKDGETIAELPKEEEDIDEAADDEENAPKQEGEPEKEEDNSQEANAEDTQKEAEVLEQKQEKKDPFKEEIEELPEPELPQYLCKPEVNLTIGFSPRIIPDNTFLQMCPSIQYSCCSVKDQVLIYKNWIEAKEKQFIQERFEWYEDTYKELFEKLEEVDKWAKRTLQYLEEKPISNCQILASRITPYQIKYIAPKLLDQLKFTYEYLEHYYQGFYCAMCNAENHQFIDVIANKIQLPISSCRMMVQKTLFPQMYLKVYFNEYLNIVSKFVNSCTFKGKFQNEVTHKEQSFNISHKHKQELQQCFKYRNKPDWFNKCKFICQNAGIISIADQFVPRFTKLRKYGNFLEKKLKVWRDYEDEYEIFLKLQKYKKKKTKKKAYRILAEDKKKKKKKNILEEISMKKIFKVNKVKKFADKTLFSFGIAPLFDFKKAKREFARTGIDFYQSSKASMITKDTMKQVLTQVKKLEKGDRKLISNQNKNLTIIEVLQIFIFFIIQLD